MSDYDKVPSRHATDAQWHSLRPLTGAIVALFLAAAAVQFVVAGSMPASTYVTSLGVLIIFSYFVLLFDGMESVLVFNIGRYTERQRMCAFTLAPCRALMDYCGT